MTRPLSKLLTSSAFVAMCAVALAWESSLVAGVPAMSDGFYAFLFFATWTAYRIHAIRRVPPPSKSLTIATASMAVVFATTLPPRMWPTLAIATVFSVAYSVPTLPRGRRLREFGLLKILTLAGVWTLATGYLPLMDAGLPAGELTVLALRRFLFMFALCLAFDVRDVADDARAGIRTVAVRVGVDRSYRLMRGTLVAFALLIFASPLVAMHLGAVSMALAISALLTWLAIEGSRRATASRLYHLGFVDGMMVVQSVLVTMATLLSHHA